MNIKEKIFIVTGGASGLGRACVERFVREGAKTVIFDANAQAAEKLAAELGAAVRVVAGSVTSEEDAARAVEVGVSELGGLHGAICCAGIGTAEKVVSKDGKPHSFKAFMKTVEVNLGGTFNVIRLAAARMATLPADSAGERGVFIGTASIAAFEGQWGQSAYSASKGGIVAMTVPIARELAPLGIRMVTIAPGIFDTPMLASLPENVKAALGQTVPYPARLGQPEEFAQMAQHIVENQMLNGTVIRLDGAMRMPPR